jgi:hypothetical protein
MGKRRQLFALALIAVGAIGLAGCSGASTGDQARDACVHEALKSSHYDRADASKVSVTDVGSALFGAGVNSTNDTSSKSYMVAGDVILTKGSTESRVTVSCTVDFKDGTLRSVKNLDG